MTFDMDRGLVVINDTQAHKRLLREAGQFTAGTDAELVLFSWMTPEQYEEGVNALETIGNVEHTTYDESTALDMTTRFARELADEAFTEFDGDINYEVEGVVTDDDDISDAVLDAAERLECDHIFVVGRSRSPTGKAIFGDIAQRIILNFDGLVTTATT